ncbi:hypothetical protein Tco_0167493 [Tanacetum coccineum]
MYKQNIVPSFIGFVIAAILNFGFKRKIEEDRTRTYLHLRRLEGIKNKGWKLWRSPYAVCGSSASLSTKGAKNGNERRFSTLGLGDVEVWFSDVELGVASR